MPKVNKVGQPVSTPVASSPPENFSQVEREQGHAKGDLIESNPPATQGTKQLVLPDYLTSNTGSNLPAVAIPDITGYAGFADSRGKNWATLQANGIEEGEGFINDVNNFIRCHPMEHVLLKCSSFRTHMVGQDMKLMWASEDVDDDRNPDAQAHYVALILVKVDNTLIPVLGDFRGTKSGAVEGAIQAIKVAGTEQWAKISDAHKVSCAFPQPWGRVWSVVNTRRGISRSNGNHYYACSTRVQPTSASQIQMLIDAFASETFVNKLNKANQNFEARCKIYLDKAKETPVQG